jgi:hypothetical protein
MGAFDLYMSGTGIVMGGPYKTPMQQDMTKISSQPEQIHTPRSVDTIATIAEAVGLSGTPATGPVAEPYEGKIHKSPARAQRSLKKKESHAVTSLPCCPYGPLIIGPVPAT